MILTNLGCASAGGWQLSSFPSPSWVWNQVASYLFNQQKTKLIRIEVGVSRTMEVWWLWDCALLRGQDTDSAWHRAHSSNLMDTVVSQKRYYYFATLVWGNFYMSRPHFDGLSGLGAAKCYISQDEQDYAWVVVFLNPVNSMFSTCAELSSFIIYLSGWPDTMEVSMPKPLTTDKREFWQLNMDEFKKWHLSNFPLLYNGQRCWHTIDLGLTVYLYIWGFDTMMDANLMKQDHQLYK